MQKQQGIKTTSKVNITNHIIYIDDQRVLQYYLYLGLPEDHRKSFALQPCWRRNCPKGKACDGHIRITRPETAFRLNRPLWRLLNRVINPNARCTIYDVCGILNICFEFEFRSDPDLALETAILFRDFLIEKGFAPKDLPIFLSGGGVHIIINIPEIPVVRETAKRWNEAIKKFVKQHIEPLFRNARDMVSMMSGVNLDSMKIEGTDIARLLSGSGDWRPSRHEEDHQSLKGGFLRHVYQDQEIIRHEWPNLRVWIEKYYREIEDNPQEFVQTMYKSSLTPLDEEITDDLTPEEERSWRKKLYARKGESTADAVRRTLTWKMEEDRRHNKISLKEDKEIDRSKAMNRYCWALNNRLKSKKAAYVFRHVINDICGGKYDTKARLDSVVRKFVADWKPSRGTDEEKQKIVEMTEIPEKTPKVKMTEFHEDFLSRFLFVMYEFSTDGEVEQQEFFSMYEEACSKNNQISLGAKQITRFLSFRSVVVQRKRKSGKLVRVYSGIKMKS